MRERQAFERQLAREIDRQAGPRARVDAMAITRAAHAPKWGIKRMFSPTSFVTAGSVAAAALAVLVIAQPLGPGDGQPAPAAEQEVAAPVAFTGELENMVEHDPGVYEHGSPLRTTRDRSFTYDISSFTDPRLDGTWKYVTNIDEYWQPGQLSGVELHPILITNDDGTWEGSAVSVLVPLGDSYRQSTYNAVLHGKGGYAGLTAIVEADWHDDFTLGMDFEGLILEGGLPPFPEGAATE